MGRVGVISKPDTMAYNIVGPTSIPTHQGCPLTDTQIKIINKTQAHFAGLDSFGCKQTLVHKEAVKEYFQDLDSIFFPTIYVPENGP